MPHSRSRRRLRRNPSRQRQNSSSWNPEYTFNIPPTRLIHIDIDPAELGRNYQTEFGVVADAKLALTELAAAAQGRAHVSRPGLREKIAEERAAFAGLWKDEWRSDQFPLRPERILSELRKAVPEDGFIVTDVGWNKNGVAQQFSFSVPGTFITPSGLATMGFGPSAVLGVKTAQPDRAAVALIGDGAFSSNMSVIATAMEANLSGRCLGWCHGQLRLWHHRRPREDALRLVVWLHVRVRRQSIPNRLRGDRSGLWCTRSNDQSCKRTWASSQRSPCLRVTNRHPGSDGKCSNSHTRILEHQRHLPKR